jgi:nucleotide-binding universal stress UspA family protein
MMFKCPVCGAHAPTATAVEIPVGKGTERFCSVRCATTAGAGEARSAPLTTPPPLAAPRAIRVAVDGSGPSVRAVEMAVSIARATKGKVTLIHAIDPALFRLLPLDSAFGGATRLGLDPGKLEEDLRRDAVASLERCGRICEAGGVEYTSRIEMKQPARAIADAAEQADLIVMGSRGLGALSGAALGSLSHRVIGETRRPVLIVH